MANGLFVRNQGTSSDCAALNALPCTIHYLSFSTVLLELGNRNVRTLCSPPQLSPHIHILSPACTLSSSQLAYLFHIKYQIPSPTSRGCRNHTFLLWSQSFVPNIGSMTFSPGFSAKPWKAFSNALVRSGHGVLPGAAAAHHLL